MDHKEVINRISNLQEFEVQITVPSSFRFNGTVPFDMEILGNQAFVKVLAETIDEAKSKAEAFFVAED